MKAILAGVWAVLLGGCVVGSGGLRMELSSAVKAGETVDVMRIKTKPERDFSETITNLGPLEKESGEDCSIEILNGADVLGRLARGESRTFSRVGDQVDLKVRAEGAGTRFEGLILGSPR